MKRSYYKEYKGMDKKEGTGNVLCIISEERPPESDEGLSVQDLHQTYICLTSITPDGPVDFTTTTLVYLFARCEPITENEAKEIHPCLFLPLEPFLN